MKRQAFVRRGVVFSILVIVFCFQPFIGAAKADTFGSRPNSFEIEFVPIGNRDNPGDTNPVGHPNHAGKVEYAYRMGKYEISREMVRKANNEGGLGITIDTLGYVSGGPRDPAAGVSWFEAARFVNWLNTSKGHTPAYKFNGSTFELWQSGDAGYSAANPFRNSQAFYLLPSADEWYKAAYYDPAAGVYYNFPTGSDAAPKAVYGGTESGTAVYDHDINQGSADINLAGGISPFGTVGQGGNVEEWEETEFDLVNDSSSSFRGFRGGSWASGSSFYLEARLRRRGDPTIESGQIGFRVASIPEPSSLALSVFVAIVLMIVKHQGGGWLLRSEA